MIAAPPRFQETIRGDVLLDGQVFVECTFEGARICFEGSALFVLSDCIYIDCTFTWGGDALVVASMIAANEHNPVIAGAMKALRDAAAKGRKKTTN